MGRQTGKNRWAEQTLAEARATARTIMGEASLPVGTGWVPLEHYLPAGFRAQILLEAAVALVQHHENIEVPS